MSFGKVVSLMSDERPDIVASRLSVAVFRHSAIYHTKEFIHQGTEGPQKASGSEFRNWAAGPAIYVRGMLQHDTASTSRHRLRQARRARARPHRKSRIETAQGSKKSSRCPSARSRNAGGRDLMR